MIRADNGDGILHLRKFLSRALAALVMPAMALTQPLLSPGDSALRQDLQLLADAGIVRVPVTTWPMSWPDIAREVGGASARLKGRSELEAPLARVRAAATRAARNGVAGAVLSIAGARDPQGLRTFEDTPREEGELGLQVTWLGSRVAMNLELAAVDDPDDGKDVRLDGSFIGITIANWMITGGALPRWWGPGWEGSLILSSNARPMPGIAIERNYSDPPSWRGLRWIGPWRATVSMSALESRGVAVPDARFFAARVTARPRPWLELGLSRTAQWCGEGRPCDLSAFTDLLLGRDNREPSETGEREPGNQMAGYDLRIRSPWGAVPAAVYLQLIGEDEAGGLPSKFLGLAGAEVWAHSRWGAARLHVEYTDTTCNFSRRSPAFDCAYRNGLYPQGYAFRSRAIGHALDADGRMSSIGLRLGRPDGASWAVLYRRIVLNRGGAEPEPTHTSSTARDQLNNLELQYNRAFARGALGVGMSLDDFDGPLRSGSELRGFVQWRQGI
jgi:hypothetical protein